MRTHILSYMAVRFLVINQANYPGMIPGHVLFDNEIEAFETHVA